MKLLNIGTIVKQKVLAGEVKVFRTTDFPEERYKIGNKLYLHNEKTGDIKEVTVRSYYPRAQFDFVGFEEMKTLAAIYPYLEYKICIDKDQVAPLEDGMYYFCDMIGCTMIDEKFGEVGVVTEMEEFTGIRSFRVKLKSNGKSLLVPYLDVYIKNIDVEKKIITSTLVDGMMNGVEE